jgi:hypothetical protein
MWISHRQAVNEDKRKASLLVRQLRRTELCAQPSCSSDQKNIRPSAAHSAAIEYTLRLAFSTAAVRDRPGYQSEVLDFGVEIRVVV